MIHHLLRTILAGITADAMLGIAWPAASQAPPERGSARDEIARAHAAGADTLATIYHGCQRLLCGFEAGAPLVIEHYLSVFARGLGIEFEDTYKRWTLAGDPAAILAEASPCMEANAVDPAQARAFVERTFVPLPRRAPETPSPS